jgi:hypothetical protein
MSFRNLLSFVLKFLYFDSDESRTSELVKTSVNGYLEEAGLTGRHHTVTDEGSNMLSFGKINLKFIRILF